MSPGSWPRKLIFELALFLLPIHSVCVCKVEKEREKRGGENFLFLSTFDTFSAVPMVERGRSVCERIANAPCIAIEFFIPFSMSCVDVLWWG
jgi:hypothetical protein